MNNEMVRRHYKVTDDMIDDGEIQSIITPLWWTVSIYDGETEMNDALEQFSDPQKYVWAIQWYVSEVENGGHDQFFYNSTGIVWELALEGLRAMNCDQFVEILEQAAQRIGGHPSLDREQRWLEMDRHNADFGDLDREFYDYDRLLEERTADYIRANRRDFYFDGMIDIPEQFAPDDEEY